MKKDRIAQIQKIQNMMNAAIIMREKITRGRSFSELNETEYGTANYWDGKVVALSDVLRFLGL